MNLGILFSNGVNRKLVVTQQNSDRLVPLKKQNKRDDNANNAIGSVGGNKFIIIIIPININRAPLREDVI